MKKQRQRKLVQRCASRKLRLATRGVAAERRGILLLVVLSLLVLFLLVGTSYVVSSNQYRKANKTLARPYEPAASPLQHTDLLEEVINQLVRDTTNQYSSLRYHSLLRDLYGEEGFAGEVFVPPNPNSPRFPIWAAKFAGATVGNPNGTVGRQVIEFTVYGNTANPLDPEGPLNLAGAPAVLSRTTGYYNGRVLTWVTGPLSGQSMRVVGYHFFDLPGFPTFRFRVVLTPGTPQPPLTTSTARPPEIEQLTNVPGGTNIGARFVLNGQPFNGTGAGYNPYAAVNEPKLNARESIYLASGQVNWPNSPELALLPNSAQLDPNAVELALVSDPNDYFITQNEQSYLSTLTPVLHQRLQAQIKELRGLSGLGGSDESYDAVDFQNMALAWSPVSPGNAADPNDQVLVDRGFDNILGTNDDGPLVLPSFHRPALLNYWANRVPLRTEPNLLRKVMMRPSWFDHPKFTGSNPDLAPLVATFERELATGNASNYGPPSQALLDHMIFGPWDVDNDKDGRRDSEWVDFGAPVMMGPEGRLVKPMAAILCVDMDGRLNLNAHGTRNLAGLSTTLPSLPIAGSTTSGLGTGNLPEGQGYGPAEISLEPVLSVNGVAGDTTRFEELLMGGRVYEDVNDATSPSRVWFGRYGSLNQELTPQPGYFGSYDLLAQLKQQGLPQWANQLGNYATPPDLKGRYVTALNDLGQPIYEAVGHIGDLNNQLDQDSPYELDLSRVGPNAAGDNAKDGPFSLAEIERILRAFDKDAGKLPPRLWELANRFRTSSSSGYADIEELNEWRALLTTDSFSLPVPSVVLPEWMRVGPNGTNDPNSTGTSDDFNDVMGREPVNLAFADLLEYRVRLGLGFLNPATVTPVQQAQIQQVLSQLLAPELADGLRIDLNRPFGNGKDDNNNGVVDEPGEVETVSGVEAPYWDVDPNRAGFNEALVSTNSFDDPVTGAFRDNFDRDGDGTINAWERGDTDNSGNLDQTELVNLHNFRRQLFARHLYVLAMTLVDPVPIPAGGVTDPKYIENTQKRARQLAQWAINVADFRDPDNIMTGFEYDADPFDGWGKVVGGTFRLIDGDVNDPNDIYGSDGKPGGAVGTPAADVGGLVWGAERPELLITETLAWHDRRTRDSRFEGEVDLREVAEEQQPTSGKLEKGDVPMRQPASNGGSFDKSFDQQQRPQGAAFIELYNPWPEETAANADTHAVEGVNINTGLVPIGTDLGMDLARTHNNDPNTGSPVWRIMVYRNGGIDKNPDALDKDSRPTNFASENRADRCVYFTGQDPADILRPGGRPWDDDGVAFFNNVVNPNLPPDTDNRIVPPVRPGRYMVVAGVDTDPDIGDMPPTSAPGEFLIKFGENNSQSSQRGILLKTNPSATDAVSLLDSNGSPVMDKDGFPVQSPAEGSIPGIVAMPGFGSMTSVAIIDRAMPSVDYSRTTRRFTFTEPPGGYPDSVPVESDKPFSNSRFDRGKGKHGEYVPILDVPLDDFVSRQSNNAARNNPNLGQRRPPPDMSLNDGETRLALPSDDKGSRTIPGFNWVYLQRLANPLMSWNPPSINEDGSQNLAHDPNSPVNPYRTIDGMGVNVTVFNGLTPDGRERQVDNGKLLSFSNKTSQQTFTSNQRGRLNDPTQDVQDFMQLQNRVQQGRQVQSKDPDAASTPFQDNLWTAEPINRESYWQNKAGSRGLGLDALNDTGHAFEALPDCTLGFMNEPFRAPGPGAPRDVPEYPFSWFTWNNRPYTGAGELLQVPKLSLAELPRAFAFVPSASASEVYEGATIKVSDSNGEEFELDGVFPHLANFFRSEMDPNSLQSHGIAGLYRVLDYVGVPSRYVGTETWLNPAAFGEDGTPATQVSSVDDPRYERQPPFNNVSAYRDPGRVNINTIGAGGRGAVWHGMFIESPKYAGVPNNSEIFAAIDDDGLFSVRRGYGTFGVPNGGPPSGDVTFLNPQSPTLFANPFRASGAGDLVPIPDMLRRLGSGVVADIECTLLRSMGDPPFMNTSVVPTGAPQGVPLLSTGAPEPYRNSARNAYFRYQPLSRVTSMATTQSNVYAVWITIGFFEVEEAPDKNTTFRDRTDPSGNLSQTELDALYARVYPEGYQLGQEMGIETGDVERLREFAIIDRSIPVAFEPGEDHNVEKAVRLRRRIE